MRKNLRNLMILMLLLVFAATGLFANGSEEKEVGVTDDSITLGTFQAMSGPLAVIGVPVADGLRAYFEHVNANGGVHGRRIELIIADDQFNPKNTVIETTRLVESDNVFAMVCGLGTGGNLAVMDYLETNKVPFVYQASGSSKLAVPPKEYIFPVQPNYLVEGNVMVRYLAEERGMKNIAIVYRNAEDGKEEYESVKDTIAKVGATLVHAVSVDPAATDFSTEITAIAAADPDAIIVMTFGGQTANFVKQAKQYGLTKQLYLLSYPNASVTFFSLAGEAGEGVETMAWVDVDFTDADYEPFKMWQEFKGDESLPNAFALAGMVAAEVFVEALERTGRDLTRENFIHTLEGFDDWSGAIAQGISYKPYDAEDDSCRLGKQSMYVLRAENGTWVRGADWIYYKE